jgi:hypothetical protein
MPLPSWLIWIGFSGPSTILGKRTDTQSSVLSRRADSMRSLSSIMGRSQRMNRGIAIRLANQVLLPPAPALDMQIRCLIPCFCITAITALTESETRVVCFPSPLPPMPRQRMTASTPLRHYSRSSNQSGLPPTAMCAGCWSASFEGARTTATTSCPCFSACVKTSPPVSPMSPRTATFMNRLDGLAREPWKILSCELEHCCPVGLRKLPQEPAHPGLSKALVALEGSFILLSWGGARQRPSRALEAPEPRARGAGPRC